MESLKFNIIRIFVFLCYYVAISYGFVAWKYRTFLKVSKGLRPLLTFAHVFIALSNIVAFFVFIMLDRHTPISTALSWLGLAIAIAGAVLLIWSGSILGLATFIPSADGKLITTGPYRITTHPMYLGGVIGGFGLAIWSASLLGLVYALVILLTLMIIAREEERELLERFGSAYLNYKKQTLIPFA